MKKLFLTILIIVFAPFDFSISAHEAVEEAALGDTKSVHSVGDIMLAAQPGPEDLKLARERGFETVLSIRHSDEVDFDEGAVVRALGMRFIHIPWNGEKELTDSIFDAIRTTLKTSEKPLLFHCGTANRTACAWFVSRVLDEGVEIEEALKEAKATGLTSEAYEDKALDYIQRRSDIAQLSAGQLQACLEIGENASSSLMTSLGAQLKGALAGGDVGAALEVCKTAAQPVTDSTSEAMPGVTVGRTSLKVRNVGKNLPDASDLQILNQWQKMGAKSEALESTLLIVHENAVRYYRPIFTQGICLKCHGPTGSLGGPVTDLLAELYPEDRATGYAEGDLRGAFRVEIDLDKALE